MKSIYNSLKTPVSEVIKEGIKTTNVLEQAVKHLKIEDKVNINSNKFEKFEQQGFSYKPSIMSDIQKKTNDLFCISRHNFSSITKSQVSFYSSVTGEDKLVDVTSDYVFKGIFRDEARTINFLESVLVGEGKILPKDTKILELEYLPTEYGQHIEDGKILRFDLQVKTSNGIFIIEMQKNVSQDYLKRVGFYSATAYSQQQIKGMVESTGKSSMKDYTKALPIIIVSVIDGKLFPDKKACVSYHTIVDLKTQERDIKAFSYVFIELGKFAEDQYDQSNITSDNEKDWLSFMKKQDLKCTYSNDQVNSAVKYVENIKTHEYDTYIRYQITELAKQKEIESAEQKGENKKAIEIARNLKKSGIDVNIISEATGLNKEQIEKLKI